jgi:hypothetical protein
MLTKRGGSPHPDGRALPSRLSRYISYARIATQ